MSRYATNFALVGAKYILWGWFVAAPVSSSAAAADQIDSRKSFSFSLCASFWTESGLDLTWPKHHCLLLLIDMSCKQSEMEEHLLFLQSWGISCSELIFFCSSKPSFSLSKAPNLSQIPLQISKSLPNPPPNLQRLFFLTGAHKLLTPAVRQRGTWRPFPWPLPWWENLPWWEILCSLSDHALSQKIKEERENQRNTSIVGTTNAQDPTH